MFSQAVQDPCNPSAGLTNKPNSRILFPNDRGEKQHRIYCCTVLHAVLYLQDYHLTGRRIACTHTHKHTADAAMHSRHPKIVWWKNLYWCPVISALLQRGLVIQLAYNSHCTLCPHMHLPSCSTATRALIICKKGKGVEALLDGALRLIPANPYHLWTEVIQPR